MHVSGKEEGGGRREEGGRKREEGKVKGKLKERGIKTETWMRE